MRGPLQASGPAAGMVEDFDAIAGVVQGEVIETLDHISLNDVIENPTCERIVSWIWERLDRSLPGLDELVLWETATSCAILRRSDFVRS